MANRSYSQFRFSLEKMTVDLFCRFLVGATGAPTLQTTDSKGIKSIVRNGVGDYTITLSDVYRMLLCVEYVAVSATPASINAYIKADNSASATPTIRIQFVSAAGTAVELSNGEDIRMEISLRNTTAF